ncbi:unnamed protein product [Meloidogyne enterolobii]|uniref:Uncharacterized protein n=1 Tax=Meloidogyne enterolobii TaxID=390850 RepID=A0ACB0XXL8_MELEN
MCITFIINADNDLILGRFKLILLNNRDEEFSRPTSALAWCDGILAGKLVTNFLNGQTSAEKFLFQLGGENYKDFNGFQFVILERIEDCYELYSFTNRFDNSEPVHWPKGLHVFSNSPRITPFKKAIYGEKLLQSLIDQFSTKIDFTEEDLINGLFEIGSNTEIHFPDEQIRLQTGSTDSKYKLLCSIFVNGHLQGRNYGTKYF